MKAMLLAFVALAVISVGSNLILQQVGFSSQDRTAGADVRLDD
jgi:predicted secreted protein